MFIPVSENLLKLAKLFPEDLYIVGGYVRNCLLNIENSDIDLCSNVDIEEISKILKENGYKIKVKNAKYNSIVISKGNESYEFTSFRKDYYPENGSHSPIRVERTDKLLEDAKRRDFTINSIYYNITKDEIVDPFHGVVDAKQKILRCITSPEEVLKNDGERILRMVRIVGELNLKIEKNTLKYAHLMAKNVADISSTRKFNELEKILYCDKRYKETPGNFVKSLNLLNKLYIWQYFGLPVKVIKYNMVKKVEDRVLGLLIDIVDSVKPECLQTFIEKFLQSQFGFTTKLIQKIFIYMAGYYNALNKMKNKEYFFKYFEDVGVIFPLLAKKSKHIMNKYMFFYKYILRYGLVVRVADLKISKEDIAQNYPNIDTRNYDRLLEYLLSEVFDGKVRNEKEYLLQEVDKILSGIV